MEAHGWRLFVHPLFQAQLEKLVKRVGKLASSDPDASDRGSDQGSDQGGYVSHPATKILATINHYIRDAIPRDPHGPEFRQGNTLGQGNRHWFRARFYGRYRLFCRFSTGQRIIVYVWVDDEGSLRKSGSKTGPYAVFKAMIETGEPPNSFAELLRATNQIDASEGSRSRPTGKKK
jgi:toxin YhaV